MSRFQLVFRTSEGDASELHDNSLSGEPRVDGVQLTDGAVFTYHGVRWIAKREDLDGMIRFVCTPAVDGDGAAGTRPGAPGREPA